MAKSLTLTSPDVVFNKMIDALCHKGNWEQTGDLTLGDAGKVEFAKKVLADFIEGCVCQHATANAQKTLSEQQQQLRETIEKDSKDAKAAIEITTK